MSPTLFVGLVTGVCLAAAIVVFFWSVDQIRIGRAEPDPVVRSLVRPKGENAWQFMERYVQPIAEILNERNQRRGKVTLADRIARGGMHVTSSEFLLIQFSLAAFLAVLGLLFFGLRPAVLILAVAGAIAPNLYLSGRQGARQAEFDKQLGNMVTLLSNSLKTGYSLVQAIETVAKKSPPPVSEEFDRCISAIQFGASVEDALAAVVERVQNPDLDFIVIAILLHRRVGGNLAEILDNIGETIRERLRMKREMSVVTAHARASSRVISALPIILAALMYMITPTYFTPMITNPIGWFMIAFAVILVVSGNMIMGRMSVARA